MVRRTVRRGQRGMVSAEYALGTVAACGFACVLLQLLPYWRSLLTEIFVKAVELRVGWQFTTPW